MVDSVKTRVIDLKKYFWLISSIWTFFVIAISVWSLLDHKIVAFGHFFLWLLGFLGIVMFTRHLKYSILEREKAGEKLIKEKERSELYLNIAEIGIAIVTSDEKIDLVNEKGGKVLGYEHEELIGKNWFELLVPCSIREEVRGVFQQLMAGEIQPVEFYENTLLTKNGEERLFSFHNTVIRDENGQISGVVFSTEDIDERRGNERQLNEANEYLENLFNYASVPIIVWDRNFKIMRFNRAFEHLTGKSAQFFLGRSVEVLFPEKTFQESVTRIRRTLNGEKLGSVEIPIINGQGRTVTVLWNSANLFDSDGETVVATIAQGIDITERKKSEKALQAKTNDLSERIKELNCLFGLSKLINEKKILDDIFYGAVELIPPGWRYSDITCAKIIALGSEYESNGFEQSRWRQTADIIVSGQLSGYIEVFYKQQRPEEDEGPFIKEERDLINALAERLGKVLERKAVEQKVYAHQLEVAHMSRLNSIGEMASSLAHEINQPLFVIQAQAERSSKLLESGTENIGTVIDKMQIIIEQTERANKIISRIRKYVSKGTLEKQVVSLNVLINNSLELLQIEVQQKKIELQLDISKDALNVNVDAVQIEQVIVNLIINSIDAMDETPEGKRYLFIKTTETQGNAELRISDSGMGMDPKEVEMAFDSFYTTKSYGMGIGLSISRSIIESHGGRIRLEANAGKGMTSCFTLPLYENN